MKKIALLVSLVVVGQFVKAQEDNNRVITTGVPFLLIAADARSAGMADMGVATSADAFFVKCDAENNPQDSIASGEVHIEIGVALQYPAEFVVINLSQKTSA
jgi:phage tail sheath protein FI